MHPLILLQHSFHYSTASHFEPYYYHYTTYYY